jgi:hypothetical protein
VNTPI